MYKIRELFLKVKDVNQKFRPKSTLHEFGHFQIVNHPQAVLLISGLRK